MSFFGITSLGPQNSFKTHLVNAIGLTIYSLEEFKAAFARIDRDGSGYIDVEEVKALLRGTYGCEPLDEEVAMFMIEFDSNSDGRISWEEFASAVQRIREDLEEKSKRAVEVTSFETWNYRRRKHIRAEQDPTEKYRKPLTFGQTYGFFNEAEAKQQSTSMKTFYRKKCDETRYADAMISSGHHHLG
mmetsp:Transcript_23576/g.41791  ORF Transcript_23576/g.41791 Transcript_23576/m.41791 type:complete len:187 (-) Transcript_23576:2244-2804(-)